MAGFTNEIQLVNIDGLSDFERIDNELKALIVSIEGTIPGSRGFGLRGESVDLRPAEARNTFYRELDDKVEQYIPEVRIADVDLTESGSTMIMKIYVGKSDYARRMGK